MDGGDGEVATATRSSPDASTSLSEGEWRDPAAVLALETTLTAASTPRAAAPTGLPVSSAGAAGGSRPSLKGLPVTASGVMGSTVLPPWRQGGPAYQESLEIRQRPGGRAERRAERRARRSRDSLRESQQSAGSFMTDMSADDRTGGTKTDSELSDGEVAASVVWWVAAASPSSPKSPDVSDGEIRPPA